MLHIFPTNFSMFTFYFIHDWLFQIVFNIEKAIFVEKAIFMEGKEKSK